MHGRMLLSKRSHGCLHGMDMFGDGAGEVGHHRAVAREGRSVGVRRAILRRTGAEVAEDLGGRGRLFAPW
jgi:hypothetical protein